MNLRGRWKKQQKNFWRREHHRKILILPSCQPWISLSQCKLVFQKGVKILNFEVAAKDYPLGGTTSYKVKDSFKSHWKNLIIIVNENVRLKIIACMYQKISESNSQTESATLSGTPKPCYRGDRKKIRFFWGRANFEKKLFSKIELGRSSRWPHGWRYASSNFQFELVLG